MNLLRLIDKSPTIKDWPVRIWEPAEIKPAYLPCLEPWLRQGLALEHLVFVPELPYGKGTPEYMMAVREGQVLLLCPGPGGSIQTDLALRERLLYILYRTDLLLNWLEFCVRGDDGAPRILTAPFNRTTLHLFLPALNTLLGLPFDFDVLAQAKKSPVPRALKEENYAVYNHAPNALRLGPEITEYHGRRLLLPLFRRLKRHEQACVYSFPMEQGLFLQKLDGYRTEGYYFPWAAVGKETEYCSEKTPEWEIFLASSDGSSRHSAVKFFLAPPP